MKFDFTPAIYGLMIGTVFFCGFINARARFIPEGHIHVSFTSPTTRVELNGKDCEIPSYGGFRSVECKISGETGLLYVKDVFGDDHYFLLEKIESTPNKWINIDKDTIFSDIPVVPLQKGPKYNTEPGPIASD